MTPQMSRRWAGALPLWLMAVSSPLAARAVRLRPLLALCRFSTTSSCRSAVTYPQAGKSTLGFLNNWLYQVQASNPNAFFDVVQGDNQYACCGYTGFNAYRGKPLILTDRLGPGHWSRNTELCGSENSSPLRITRSESSFTLASFEIV